MASRWLPRVAVAAAVVGAMTIFGTSAASADDPTIELLEGQKGSTAADFESENEDCSEVTDLYEGVDFDDKDIWVFNLPDNNYEFKKITAEFSPGGTKVIDDEPDSGFYFTGTSKGYIILPAGATLVDASATYQPHNGATEPIKTEFFVVTHACAGTPTTTTGPPKTTQPPRTTEPPVTTTGPGDDGDLPETGAGLTGVLIAGLALVGGGAALLIARRRRDSTENPAEL